MARTRQTAKKARAGEAQGMPDERPSWPDRFLVALKTTGTISGAAKTVRVGRSTVYEEMERNPDFKADVYAVLEECVELVEETLFQAALNPEQTTDRIFYLKTRKPEVYGDKLRQDQIDQIKQEAKREVLAELDRDLQRLPPAVQRLISDAIAGRENPTITALTETTP